MENQTNQQEVQGNSNLTGEEQDISYWMNEFGIAKEELLALVKRCGTFAAAVECYVKTLSFSA